MQIKRTRKDIWLNLLHWLKIYLVPRCCFYWIFSCFHRVESLQGNPQSSLLSGNFWCWAVMWQQPWVSFGSFVILAFSTSCMQVILVLDVFSLYVQNVWQGFEQHCSAHSPQAIPPSCPLTGREDQQARKRTAGQLILIGTALHFFFFLGQRSLKIPSISPSDTYKETHSILEFHILIYSLTDSLMNK